jgi:hypothetical protein
VHRHAEACVKDRLEGRQEAGAVVDAGVAGEVDADDDVGVAVVCVGAQLKQISFFNSFLFFFYFYFYFSFY